MTNLMRHDSTGRSTNEKAQREEKRTNDALAVGTVLGQKLKPTSDHSTEGRLAAVEEGKREAKRLRKKARPMDHRDEGGQG